MFSRSSKKKTPQRLTATSVSNIKDASSYTAKFLNSKKDPEMIERVRVTIKNAHVFKLPTRQSVSVGWRGAEWKEKVWQGTIKVVERGDITAAILEYTNKNEIFAVCPILEGAVERCVDSSRYFVLRIENETGRHVFIGVAFNERNDAFDFNTALEDSRREREAELTQQTNPAFSGPTKDYSLKKGEKIRVSIPKVSRADDDGSFEMLGGQRGGTEAFNKFYQQEDDSSNNGISASDKDQRRNDLQRRRVSPNKGSGRSQIKGGFLRPSSKDTPSRAIK